MRSLSDQKLDRLRRIATQPDFSGTKYRLIRELGHGGMGTVYLAEDSDLNREVAVKVLNASADEAALSRRMVREAQIIARLEHPGIVPVHDVGVLADGRVFYAMKLIRGERLDKYITNVASLKDRLRKFQAACDAVSFAHAHGVIHRDLKPQNIMIGTFGEVLVVDWGVAKILPPGMTEQDASEAETLRLLPGRHSDEQQRQEHADETTHGTIIGTAKYMSPEQQRGEIDELDQRSDVYSLGAILYFLLTNRAPAAIRPREVDAKVSKAAEAVCLKAMSVSSADRYASAADLGADVARLLNDEPVSAYRENWLEKVWRWLNKNRVLVLIVLAYLLVRIFFLFSPWR
ncbi:MAG TPA: serine/threonine-protein kinase [Pyrinomonadaceae bacterium]|nr:serine/threonine-protein kinase [Pyrinomonadaceae bacterium]